VTIYRDGASGPAAVVYSASGVAASGATCTVGQSCNISVPLSGAPSLGPGNYWVSVQLAGTYAWYWAVDPPGNIFGAAALWQNPGNGFGRNCTSWATLAQCNWTTAADGSDLIYRLEGTLTDSSFKLSGFLGHGVNTLKLDATFPGPGVAVVQDASRLKKAKGKRPALVKKVKVNVGRGQKLLPIKLTSTALKKLGSRGKVVLPIAVTYTPQGGIASTQRTKLTLNAR
jgi:hypothetical protein